MQLAKQVREADETVSRKLKELRSEGVVEFRREGRSTVNFLTPQARIVFAEQCHLSRIKLMPSPLTLDVIYEYLQDSPAHYRHAMTFSMSQSAAVEI
jgi:DNA-binding transcriptional ArsR family regulator